MWKTKKMSLLEDNQKQPKIRILDDGCLSDCDEDLEIGNKKQNRPRRFF